MRQKNFPIPLTSLIGRQKEAEEVERLLSATRLLTLLGPGGVGKTRLALEAASASIKKYSNGGCWVDLASLIYPSLIPQTIAKLLGAYVTPNQSPLKTLEGYLQSKQLLLVLDNCEHLIVSCAELVEHLLNTCPKLHVLIVSREVLGVYGEVIWHVPSLPFPDVQALPPIQRLLEYPSIRLFIERAAAVLPGYSLSEQNYRPITQICQKLDGLPLAIELAAARITLLSAKEIADRLTDRFDLLTGGSRNVLPRQQTLRAALDWSYEFLTESEQSLFRRLSVFADNFSLEAAEQIACPNLPATERFHFLNLLVQLVNKSLINVNTGLPGSESDSRYRMLETIREYAREKLGAAGETMPVYTRFVDYYQKFVIEAELKLYNQEQDAWSDQIEAEYDNLRNAIEWSLENKDAELAAQLAIHLSRFWQLRWYSSEAAIWLDRILAWPGITDQTRAKLLLTRGHIARVQGDYEKAKGYVEDGLAILRAYEDRSSITQGNVIIGIITIFQGAREKGIKLLEECLQALRETGDEWHSAFVLLYISDAYNRIGDNTRASLLCQESLSLFNKLGDPWGIAFASGIAGEIARQQGNLQKAKEYFRKNFIYYWQHGQKGEIPYPLETLSLIAINEMDYLRAARLWGAAEEYRKKANAPLPPAYQIDYHKYLALIQEKLGEKAFGSAIIQGRELLPQALFDLATHDDLTPPQTPSSISTQPILEFRLTKRETEILRLVANGMTDSQIAEQLFLSPRTIGKHLESIYSKLQVNSRTAATHYALTHKLIEQ